MTQQSLPGQFFVETVTLHTGSIVTCNIFMIVSDASCDDFCALVLPGSGEVALVSGRYWRSVVVLCYTNQQDPQA